MKENEVNFKPVVIMITGPRLGRTLQRLQRAQAVIGMVRDAADGTGDPHHEQWSDSLTLACEELDRLFDDLVFGPRR